MALFVVVACGWLIGCKPSTSTAPPVSSSHTSSPLSPPALAAVKARTAARYPAVHHVDPQQVQAWLADGEPAPLLLDVREPAEFEVSHLLGALRVDPKASAASLKGTALKEVPSDRRIVTYCAVGVRSAIMAQRLQEAGYTHVSSMNGSIFEWANEGAAVYRGDGLQVHQVHPYDEKWGELLLPGLHAEVPPIAP